MGGGILGASEDGSDLRLTAAEASVVQQESFPPYFRRGEQSGGREGEATPVTVPSFLGRWWWYEDKKGCDTGIVDTSSSKPSCRETEAQAAQACKNVTRKGPLSHRGLRGLQWSK